MSVVNTSSELFSMLFSHLGTLVQQKDTKHVRQYVLQPFDLVLMLNELCYLAYKSRDGNLNHSADGLPWATG